MQFYTPRNIEFGRGSIEKLQRYVDGRAIIITGKNTWGSVKDFVNMDYPVHIFTRTSSTGEPTERDIENLAKVLINEEPQTIIAIGGGSVIDATKLAWIFYEHPEITWNEIYSYKIPPLRRKSKIIAAETTSGTGTGISAAAVVIDQNRIKRGIVSEQLIVDASAYDPNLVLSMSRNTAIYSGMDALTHAIEAYISKINNIPADTLALKAIELIYRNLPESADGDERARELVHYGNMLAAMGFTNARLGLCHAAAHPIGGRFDIEHGKINAILLPYVVRVNEKCTSRIKDIARVMGVDDVAQALLTMNEEFDIPVTIDFVPEDHLESIASEIEKSALMRVNPCSMSREDILEFLRMAHRGEL